MAPPYLGRLAPMSPKKARAMPSPRWRRTCVPRKAQLDLTARLQLDLKMRRLDFFLRPDLAILVEDFHPPETMLGKTPGLQHDRATAMHAQVDQLHFHCSGLQAGDQSGGVGRQTGALPLRIEVAQTAARQAAPVDGRRPPGGQLHQGLAQDRIALLPVVFVAGLPQAPSAFDPFEQPRECQNMEVVQLEEIFQMVMWGVCHGVMTVRLVEDSLPVCGRRPAFGAHH